METKFTKGNWFIKESKFEKTDITCQTVLMTDLKYNDIKSPVSCDLYGQATDEGKANANLVSAAPDMFNALEELLAQVKQFTAGNIGEQDYFRDEISNAKKAIKKATE